MKKIKIFSIILFLVSIAAFAGCRVYDKVVTDHVPPVISGGEEVISVSVEDSKEKLLEGMKAEDKRDGDVTDLLVVQDISVMDEEGLCTVSYAAADRSGNVAYSSRQMKYTDYHKPVFKLSEPLRYPVGSSFNVCQGISASSVLDGDMSDKIKYTIDRAISSTTEGVYQVEFRVMDSAGKTSYLSAELEIYDPGEERGEVVLSDYLIYLEKGQPFAPQNYYKGSDIKDGELKISSDVNTEEPGTYKVDYAVSSGSMTGKSRLVVVVES